MLSFDYFPHQLPAYVQLALEGGVFGLKPWYQVVSSLKLKLVQSF
jgi:hypothetical protein